MDDALIKPHKVRCSVKIAAPWRWDDEYEDWVEQNQDVTAVGTLVEVKDPRQLRAREFRADMVHGPDSTSEDVVMTDLAPALEATLNGTDSILLVAGVSGGSQTEHMDGAEGLAAAAVWQLAQELQDRQANHRANGAVGYSYHMRMQCFQLTGDSILDLLTDSPEAARLIDSPQGVIAEGVRTASATSPDEFMKYVEGAQRRMDPDTRSFSSTFYIVAVTQADYYEGWGLYGKFCLVESACMDVLAEDSGLVAVREGFDRYRGVYHMRKLCKTWKPGEPGDANGSSLTWLLRDMFMGGSVEAHVLFCLVHEKPAVSISLMELMEDCSKVQTNPVTHDHRVAGWVKAVSAERILLKQAAEKGVPTVDKETRGLVLELEKRLAAAERAKEDAQKTADARSDRAHNFQDKYVNSLEQQESMQERLIGSEEEYLKAMQALVEAQIETSEVKDQFSELQYADNVMLMMLEQEAAELKADDEKHEDLVKSMEEMADQKAMEVAQRQAQRLEEAEQLAQDLRMKADAVSEAKMAVEIQREVEKDKLENRLEAMRLEMKEGSLDESKLHFEEKSKLEEAMKEELERVKQSAEDERSRVKRALEEGSDEVRREIEAERSRAQQVLEKESSEAQQAVETAMKESEEEAQEVRKLREEEEALRESLEAEAAAEQRAAEHDKAMADELQQAREDFNHQLLELADGDEGKTLLEKFQEKLARSEEHEQALQTEVDELEDQLAKAQRSVKRASKVALDWIPEDADTEHKAELEEALASAEEFEAAEEAAARKASEEASAEASRAASRAASAEASEALEGPTVEELQQELQMLQVQLEGGKQEIAGMKEMREVEVRAKDDELRARDDELRVWDDEVRARDAELRARNDELRARDDELSAQEVELKKREAEMLELQRGQRPASTGLRGVVDPPAPAQGRLTQIQNRLLSEVEALRNSNVAATGAADADLQEQNRALQARLDLLEQSSPADRRAQAQRLTFLEKSVKDLEAERSELIVRATVAEEQLKQLQKHLKSMTEDYQMQIVNLKVKLQGQR